MTGDPLFLWAAMAGWLVLTWPRRNDSFPRIAARLAAGTALMIGAAFLASILR